MSGYFDETQYQQMLAAYPLGATFLDGVARLSRDELRSLQDRRFRAVVRRAWEVPFYRRRWSERGI